MDKRRFNGKGTTKGSKRGGQGAKRRAGKEERRESGEEGAEGVEGGGKVRRKGGKGRRERRERRGKTGYAGKRGVGDGAKAGRVRRDEGCAKWGRRDVQSKKRKVEEGSNTCAHKLLGTQFGKERE